MFISLEGTVGQIRVTPMAKFGEYIRTVRESRGWTQQQLAAEMEGSTPNVQRIEKMPAPTMQGRTYALLAKALDMTTSELDKAWRGNKLPPGKQAHKSHKSLGRAIPIINKVLASRLTDRTNLDNFVGIADGYTYAPQITDPEAFAWVIDGECMEPEYFEGEIVICSPNARYVDGWDYFVQLTAENGSENTFKRVFEEGENFRLKAINPKFADTVVHREKIHAMSLAVFVQRVAGPRKGKKT
jgi:transcriptional regulator with XRE-family HTH domain